MKFNELYEKIIESFSAPVGTNREPRAHTHSTVNPIFNNQSKKAAGFLGDVLNSNIHTISFPAKKKKKKKKT